MRTSVDMTEQERLTNGNSAMYKKFKISPYRQMVNERNKIVQENET